MDHSARENRPSLNRMALSATMHCLAGCSIGEVLGMVLGSAINLPGTATIALSVVLPLWIPWFPFQFAGLIPAVKMPFSTLWHNS